MNFSQILNALNEASAFELYRLRSAIDRKLDDPAWIDAIKKGLREGQKIHYFSAHCNAMHSASILKLHRKNLHVHDWDDGKNWAIEYASINLDGIDTQIREQKPKGLGRNEVSVGDTVGFIGRDGRERSGVVTRLNDKTVGMLVDGRRWRVSYTLLHPVVDGVISHATPAPELTTTPSPQFQDVEPRLGMGT